MRHVRVKTHFVAGQTTGLQSKRKSLNSKQHSFLQEGALTSVQQMISNKVDYDSLSIHDIRQEQKQLIDTLRQLTASLFKLKSRPRQESTIKRKNRVKTEMGYNEAGLCREFIENTHKIQLMEEEFEEVSRRLQSIIDPNSNLSNNRLVLATEIKVKELKEQLQRMKRNKLGREKEIMKGSPSQQGQLAQLQQALLVYLKNRQNLTNRIEVTEHELLQLDFNLQRQRQLFDETKNKATPYMEKDNKQHFSLLYKSQKKRLELAIKRQDREEQENKRRYYSLLMEYQRIEQVLKSTSSKIQNTGSQNSGLIEEIHILLNKLEKDKAKQQSRNSNHGKKTRLYRHTSNVHDYSHDLNPFTLTEISPREKANPQYLTIVSSKNINNLSKQAQNMNDLKQKQAVLNSQKKHNQPIIQKSRRWTKVGCIVRQHQQVKNSKVKQKTYKEEQDYAWPKDEIQEKLDHIEESSSLIEQYCLDYEQY